MGIQMSEFTSGVLYQKKYEPSVARFLPQVRQPYFHKSVNKMWNAFFLQDEQLQRVDTLRFLLKQSEQQLPLLWFHDDEEYGWGFRLFCGGYEVTSATISYDLDVQLAEIEFARRYPQMDVEEAITDNEALHHEFEHILDEVVRSEIYRQEVAKGICRFRAECFEQMINRKQVQQLAALFDLRVLTDIDSETGSSLLYDSVDLFKEIIGIEEMMWVNYGYLASGRRNE